MRVSRRRLIIGHGGRQGASRTLRPGAAVTQKDQQAIPTNLVHELTETRPEIHTGDRTDRVGPQVNANRRNDLAIKTEKKRDEAKRAAGPSVPKHKVIETPKPPKAELALTLGEPEEPKTKKFIADPQKKRDLILMKKSQLEQLAEKHGIEVELGTPKRTEILRELLGSKLGL